MNHVHMVAWVGWSRVVASLLCLLLSILIWPFFVCWEGRLLLAGVSTISFMTYAIHTSNLMLAPQSKSCVQCPVLV